MKNQLYFLLFSLFITNITFAQNSVSGRIADEKNKGIFFATVALYQQMDSSIVKATSTDENGQFNITDIKDGQYFLEASMLSYSTERKNEIVLPKDAGNTINFQLEPDATLLSTVEVTAKKPLLEQKADRMIVNVADNVTSLNGNLMDVMKKVPGAIVVNGRLSLAGQSNATILINGKTTKYMDVQSLLKDMPGDNVQKVEIIHQPGAEFEASGTGPIINIILKKNSLFGTNGTFSAGVGKGHDWRYNSSVSLSHYQGKVNINGSLGFNRHAWREGIHIMRNVNGDLYDQQNIVANRNNSFRANTSIDWDMTDQHRIGISMRYKDNQTDNVVGRNETSVDFGSDDTENLNILTHNNKDDSWSLFSINPYYTYEIDTSGQKLDLDVSYFNFEDKDLSTLNTEELDYNSFFAGQRFNQSGKTEITAIKLDYIFPFSKKLSLQFGGKYSKADLDNNLESFDENTNEEWVENTLQSNHFLYDEKISAAYSKLSFTKNDWSGTLGLRFEDSRSTGNSVTLDSIVKRNISKLFPSFSLSRSITKALGASVAYSYRIDRPSYSSLNPFVYYLDPYTYLQGNPLLRPELTHSMKFSLAYEKQPFFNIEYKIRDDAMIQVVEQNDDNGEGFQTDRNLEKTKNFSASLFFPLDFIPKISGYGGIIANHLEYDAQFLEEDFIRSKWSYTAFLQANFILPGDIKTELSGWYVSGLLEGIYESGWMYGTSIGFSKTFLNDKAKISLGLEDVFNRFWYADVKHANIDMNIDVKWDAPVINMKFSYKFGNQHMKSSKKRKSGAADEINRTNKD